MKYLFWFWRIGNLFNVPVDIHSTTFMLIAFIGLTSGWEAAVLLMMGMTMVVPHEFGHVLTARYFGVGCSRVLLLPLGGLAMLDYMPKSWKRELAIALGGPVVSLALGFLFLPIGLVLSKWMLLPLMCSIINFILFVFNMLPLYPLDGGRVLRALLHMKFSYEKATLYAVRTSEVLAVILGLVAVFFGNIGLLVTMALVFYFAEYELEQVRGEKKDNMVV